MSKKIVLGIGSICIFYWVILFLLNSSLFSAGRQCYMNYVGMCGNISDLISHTASFVRPFFIIFILSLITYRMREEIFQAWIKFAYVWVPLTLFLVFIVPEYDSSLLPIVTKGPISFFFSFLFLIISLIIIISKSHSLKKH